jgi:hypothetical protein
MAAALIAILSLTVLGIPIALAIDRGARGFELVGLGFLYGSGCVFLILLFVPMTLTSVVVAGLPGFLVAWYFANRLARQPGNPATFHALDLATLIPLTAYAVYATLANVWEWDFWAIWGLKARVFFERGGIDWRFLGSRWNDFAHPDYPLLVTLNYDFLALAGGGWSDRWLGLLNVAWAVAVLLVVRALAARETSPRMAALLTFALAWIAPSRFIGFAEGAMIAFGGAAVLFLRDALRRDDAASWRHGALLLGFAANCKNEGLALLAIVTVVILLLSRRSALRLWPAYALAAPWLILRAVHALPTDMASNHPLLRLMLRLRFTPQILDYLATHVYRPWFWVVILVGLLVIPKKREGFVLAVSALQLAAYVVAYFLTPYGVRWHIDTSWMRLTEQIALPVTFVVFLGLAEIACRGEDARDAEARSEQQ